MNQRANAMRIDPSESRFERHSPSPDWEGAGIRGSLALAFCAAVILLPTLSLSPPTGDAAEQVMTAVRGGVMHPPGFPFQAWLNRAFILWPWGALATRLSLLSWLGHFLTGFFCVEMLRRLGTSVAGRILALAAIAYHRSVWFLAVTPEVYGLAHAFIAWALFSAVRLSQGFPESKRLQEALVYGLTTGLAFSQHPITVVAIPALSCSKLLILKPKENRIRNVVAIGIPFLISFLGLYASLPYLQSGSAWPNWGDLGTPSSILRHMLRREYGTFSFGAANPVGLHFGLPVFLWDLRANWHVMMLFVIPGMVWLWRLSKSRDLASRTPVVAILGTLLLGLAVILRSQASGIDGLAETFLRKLQGAAVIPLACLLGMGFSAVESRLGFVISKTWFLASALVFTGGLIFVNWTAVDSSKRRTSDLFQEAIALTLPADTIYLSGSDVEIYSGVPVNGELRFPVGIPLMKRDWYLHSVLPKLDARVSALNPTPDEPFDLVLTKLYAGGYRVASTNPQWLSQGARPVELRGLVFVAGEGIDSPYSELTAQSALRLCSIIDKLGPLPSEPEATEKTAYRHFARAFLGASQYWSQKRDTIRSALAAEIRNSLEAGVDTGSWKNYCSMLQNVGH